MSLISSDGRSNVFDPFSLDVWDPFEGFPFSIVLADVALSARKIANTGVEAHVFNVELPGLKKEEVEDGRLVHISGESRNIRMIGGTALKEAVASSG